MGFFKTRGAKKEKERRGGEEKRGSEIEEGKGEGKYERMEKNLSLKIFDLFTIWLPASPEKCESGKMRPVAR